MARNRRRICDCGRYYVPDRFNAQRQMGCARADCKAERKRRRDRKRYQRRYWEDERFRTAEKRRRSVRRRQAKTRADTACGPPAGEARTVSDGALPAVVELRRTVTGMAVLLSGERETEAVGRFLVACTDRGRRLEGASGGTS